MNQTKEKRLNLIVYRFVCEGCGSEGELEIPANHHSPFSCPAGCGAMYVQWFDKQSGEYRLQCVVCPVFDEAA